MRGSPILRALAAFVVLLALAPLLWFITHPAASAHNVNALPVKQPAEGVGVEGRLNFSKAASHVTIQHLGKDVWSKEAPAPAESFAAEIPWPKNGVELRVMVAWPAGTQNAAMRLRITAPDGAEYDRTVWGDTAADEILTFP